jgi:hypothetical protein
MGVNSRAKRPGHFLTIPRSCLLLLRPPLRYICLPLGSARQFDGSKTSEVNNPQSKLKATRGRISGPKLLVFCSLLLLIGAALLWPSPSTAIRTAPQAISTKRQRPEFVPGQALVRFKPGRAFEGRMNVTVGRKELSATPFDGAQQVPVEVDRFEASDLVDGLRIARMTPDETLNTVAALNARDDVLYAIDFLNPAPDFDNFSIKEDNFQWVLDKMSDLVLAYALGQAKPPWRDEHRWWKYATKAPAATPRA